MECSIFLSIKFGKKRKKIGCILFKILFKIKTIRNQLWSQNNITEIAIQELTNERIKSNDKRML